MEKLLKCLSICTSEEKRTCSKCAYGDCGKSTMTCRDLLEECKIAVEKQIPKKPITYKETNRADCPICGSTVRGIDNPFGNYCAKCGQVLDWSD